MLLFLHFAFAGEPSSTVDGELPAALEVSPTVAEHRRRKHRILRIYVPIASVGAAAVAVGGGIWILAELDAWCPDMCSADRPRVNEVQYTTGALIETVGVAIIVGSSAYGVPALIGEHYRYKRALHASDPVALNLSVGPGVVTLSGTF